MTDNTNEPPELHDTVHTYNPDTHFLQPKIAGYHQLSEEDVRLINDIKMHGEKVGALIEVLRARQATEQRWLNIAQTDLQKGFMELTRAVAAPGGF